MGMNIVIVGAGPAGLAAAAFLRRQHRVTILERGSLDFATDDFGFSIVSNAYNLLQKLGVNPDNLDLVYMTHIWERTFENKEKFTLDFNTRRAFGAPSVLLRRSLLLKELHRLATSLDLEGEPAKVFKEDKVIKVDAETGIVSTEKGQNHVGDLVIGADGISSVVRNAVTSVDALNTSEEGQATTHDLLAFMACVPISQIKPTELDFLTSPSKSAGLVSWKSPKGSTDKRRVLGYHINSRELQLVGYASEDEFEEKFEESHTTIIKNVPYARAQSSFPDFSKAVTDLFAHHSTGDGTVNAWRIRDIEPVEQWFRGKALIIGDSAHAVTPHVGQGCNVSIEDAEALGFLLRDVADPQSLDAALKEFVSIRKSRVQDIARASRHVGALLPKEELDRIGEFDNVAFGKKNYRYTGAEAALKERATMQP